MPEDSLPPDSPLETGLRILSGFVSEEELKQTMYSLLTANWESDGGPIRLRGDLTLTQAATSRLFDQTRLFLKLLHEDKGAQLTPQGNLTRASVAGLTERMPWPREHMEGLDRTLTKVVNERDVYPLHIIRIICECGGLTTKRRNRLTASRKAIALSADDQAGDLFRHLFVTVFRRFNLDYLSPFERETPEVQNSIGVILWVLWMGARHWSSDEDLARAALLPYVRQKTDAVSPLPDASAWVLDNEVLQPLVWFGLLECNVADKDRFDPDKVRKFRKTPLFDQFISFHFKP
jgi:hypothetical protein